LIDAIRQALHIQRPLLVGRQNIPILIRIAGDVQGRSHPQAGRVGHRNTQFAAIALTKERSRAQKEEKSRKSCQKLAPNIVSPASASGLCSSTLAHASRKH
jgi:hypothetical protein